MQTEVLLVEDDPMIGEAVEQALIDAGFVPSWARSGWEATGFLSERRFSMILLDLGLPGKDGMVVLKELRDKGDTTPVIIMTARDALEDRLAGLNAGADDYVVKPFHMSEVIARMHAITRRGQSRELNEEIAHILSNGQLRLDCDQKLVYIGDDRKISLSKREFDLLEALMRRPGKILSRSRLEEAVYSLDEMPESNAIEYIIHGLRKKLGSEAIRNVRGLGWMVKGS